MRYSNSAEVSLRTLRNAIFERLEACTDGHYDLTRERCIIVVLAMFVLGGFKSCDRDEANVAELSDATVNTDDYYQLRGYVDHKYPNCEDEMFWHLKRPYTYERPDCAPAPTDND